MTSRLVEVHPPVRRRWRCRLLGHHWTRGTRIALETFWDGDPPREFAQQDRFTRTCRRCGKRRSVIGARWAL